MPAIKIDRGPEWKERDQLATVLTNHDDRLFALDRGALTITLTANQNDWNPTGLANANRIRISLAANYTITGLQGGVEGRTIIFQHVGATNRFVITSEDVLSSAPNRFLFAASVTVFPNQCAAFTYDAVSARWRLTSFI
jgi:hypothetical protein